MKKMIIFGSALFALGLVACNKSKPYNCVCVYTNVEDSNDTYTTSSISQNTKDAAENNCQNLSGKSYAGTLVYDGVCDIEE